MNLMTLDLGTEFSTRAILPARGADRRPISRRLARAESTTALHLFSLDQVLARRAERVEEDGERWDGLA